MKTALSRQLSRYNREMIENVLYELRRRFPETPDVRRTTKLLGRLLSGSVDDITSAEIASVASEVESLTAEIVEREASWRQDLPTFARMNWAASILAANELLEAKFDAETAGIVVDRLVVESWSGPFLRWCASLAPAKLLRCRDTDIHKIMNGLIRHYGVGWMWKDGTPSGSEHRLITCKHCFYTRFVHSHGRPDLAGVFAGLDRLLPGTGTGPGIRRLPPGETPAELAEHDITYVIAMN